MSIVKEIVASTVIVPLDQVTAIAKRAIRERHYTLVRITDERGNQGTGFCYGGSLAGHIVTVAVRDMLSQKVLNRDPHEIEAIWDDMFQDSLLHGRRGSVMRGISAIDIALETYLHWFAKIGVIKQVDGDDPATIHRGDVNGVAAVDMLSWLESSPGKMRETGKYILGDIQNYIVTVESKRIV